MKYYLLVLFTISSLNNIYSQGYYPLQVGNVWQYQDRWDSLYRFTTRAVAETLMPNGHLYTMLVSSYELDTLFFRQESSKVYSYAKHRITDSTYWQGDELWYDFSKTFLDTVTVRYYQAIIGGHEYTDTVVVTVSADKYASIFGQMRRQWGFYEKSLHYSMYTVSSITDSIGMTFYEYELSPTYDLRGAIINGVEYGIVTGIEGTPGVIHPNSFVLLQNYPNPFNPTTEIRFQIPGYSLMTLKVYNVLGEEVATLVDEAMQPGEYTVGWDASQLPSGIYFCRLQASSAVLTKKMTLLR